MPPDIEEPVVGSIVDGPDLNSIWDEVSTDVEKEDAAIDMMEDPTTTDVDKLLNLDGLAGDTSKPVAEPVIEEPEVGNIVEETQSKNKIPTFRDYQESIAGNALDQSSKYAEESGINGLMQKSSPAAQKLSTLDKQSARDRAINGATLGSAIGTQVMGKEGAIIGAHIGAIAGRGAGMAQSGEQAKLNRDSRIWNSLKTMGAVKKDGRVDFKDNSIRMPNEASGRMKNLRINPLNGNKDRSMYELDKTNPLTTRALTVARPLAKFYASGMLGYTDRDEVGKGASSASMALFANIFTDGVDNEKAVYSRAQQMAKKMGIKEKNIKAYFEAIKKDLSFDEAQEIQKGINLIFAKE